MQKIRWFFMIVGILLLLTLSIQNNELTEIKLLWLGSTLPLSVLLVLASAIGFLFGSLVTASMLRRRKKPDKQAEPAPKPTAPDPSAAKTDTDRSNPLTRGR